MLFQVLLAFGAEGDVIVLRLGVIELGNGNNEDACAIAHWNAIEILSWRTSGGGEVGW